MKETEPLDILRKRGDAFNAKATELSDEIERIVLGIRALPSHMNVRVMNPAKTGELLIGWQRWDGVWEAVVPGARGGVIVLRTAPVEIKARSAPFLPDLIKAICVRQSEFVNEAQVAICTLRKVSV